MEHLPQGVADEEGCFVYQVVGGKIGVRDKLRVGDEDKTEVRIKDGEMVSIDLVRPSRVKDSRNGPFLRLSDCSGWLFEKKYGDVRMKKIPVSTGLWTFFVDNAPYGIALRRHPIDRSDMQVGDVAYKPMQKIHCDRKVEHPSTGVTFYRVQGTEGWVFDRRWLDEDEDGSDYKYMLLEENMIETGLFVYECVCNGAIGIRKTPRAADDNLTDLRVRKGELICADLMRRSPFDDGNGPFLRLSDGSGWVFVNKMNTQLMKRVPVTRGQFELEVVHDIALRRQPIDSQSLREPTKYRKDETIRCSHMAQSSSGVTFYRVDGTDGWVFDEREGETMLWLEYEQRLIENGSTLTMRGDWLSWSPNFVREIADSVRGISEISLNEHSRVISFVARESENARINVYYTTRTIGTALSHPYQGATQLFRRNCTAEDLRKIFENPRAHTGKGYKRRRNDPSSEIVHSPHGNGLLVDREIELRNEVVDLDEEIEAMVSKKKEILKRLRDADLELAKEATSFALKVKKRKDERKERREAAEAKLAKLEAEKQRKKELQSRTCPACSRVFQSTYSKNQHYNAVHVFRCDSCYKEFDNERSLNQHKDALGHW